MLFICLIFAALLAGRLYAADTFLLEEASSFALSAENPQGAKGGGAIPETEGGLKPSPAVTVGPRETAVIADIKGQGIINSIWVGGEVVPEFILRIYWDGAKEPAVFCPLPAFFAHAVPTDITHFDRKFPVLNSSIILISPNHGMNCYWKMPFRKGFRITLTNESDRPLTHFYMINGTFRDIPENSGYFHAGYREAESKGKPFVIIDEKGKGKYMGTAIAIRTESPGCWCEGEARFYIDGDTDRPTINFTGLEDYLCGSFAWTVNGDYHTVSGLHAGLYCVNRAPGTHGYRGDVFMGYRWHDADPIYFAKDIRATLFSLGWNRDTTGFETRADRLSVTTYYYLDKP
ncbi:MAG: DUF2961 domain-containing protein [Abditibacteriota bacterium]|nr:DUF2961 domain-containing protein [Abditibacteriota bacterium]